MPARIAKHTGLNRKTFSAKKSGLGPLFSLQNSWVSVNS